MDALLTLAQTLLDSHGVDTPPKHLAGVLALLPENQLDQGQVICSEGDPSVEMWILLSGRIDVFKRDYLSQPRKLATLQAPAVLGHMGLITGGRRSARCVVSESATLLVVPEHRFEKLMRDVSMQGDAFRRLLIAGMSLQLTRGNQALSQIISEPTAQSLSLAEGTFQGWRS